MLGVMSTLHLPCTLERAACIFIPPAGTGLLLLGRTVSAAPSKPLYTGGVRDEQMNCRQEVGSLVSPIPSYSETRILVC